MYLRDLTTTCLQAGAKRRLQITPHPPNAIWRLAVRGRAWLPSPAISAYRSCLDGGRGKAAAPWRDQNPLDLDGGRGAYRGALLGRVWEKEETASLTDLQIQGVVSSIIYTQKSHPDAASPWSFTLRSAGVSLFLQSIRWTCCSTPAIEQASSRPRHMNNTTCLPLKLGSLQPALPSPTLPLPLRCPLLYPHPRRLRLRPVPGVLSIRRQS